MRGRTAAVFFLLMVVTSAIWTAVAAHDLWLVPRPCKVPVGEEVSLLAQTGMRFPESLSPVTPDRIDGAWVVDESGRRDLEGARVQGNSLEFRVRFEKPGVALAALAIKPKFIHLKPEEFNEYLEHDGLPQILELRKTKGEMDREGREMYAKFAKALLRIGEGGPEELAMRSAGLRIEILPLASPFRLAESLPVQVWFEQKPLEGVYVYPLAEGQEAYSNGRKTDGEGKVRVSLSKPGLWSLHCIHMRPHSDKSQADWESFFATVSFWVDEN